MNKVLIMLKMGWTEKQYYEEVTSETLSQMSFILEKQHTVSEWESQMDHAHGNVKVKIG